MIKKMASLRGQIVTRVFFAIVLYTQSSTFQHRYQKYFQHHQKNVSKSRLSLDGKKAAERALLFLGGIYQLRHPFLAQENGLLISPAICRHYRDANICIADNPTQCQMVLLSHSLIIESLSHLLRMATLIAVDIS